MGCPGLGMMSVVGRGKYYTKTHKAFLKLLREALFLVSNERNIDCLPTGVAAALSLITGVPTVMCG